ncbi:MAG TPA: TM2 domain-containing protein [Candidatus Thermoplasmatota archaeon]|nr:TM2 domain-containing protein [Candidatus Thermoplasmatota archaeon]
MQAPPQNRIRTMQAKPRSIAVAYLIFFVTAMLGVQMFYLRKPGLAIAKIVTLNFLFVGMLVDIVMMPTYVRRANDS